MPKNNMPDEARILFAGEIRRRLLTLVPTPASPARPAAGHVEVLGVLPDFVTITDYHVTPVVGIIPWPAELRLSAAELSEAFGVPLRWLADPAHLRVEYWNIPGRPDETPVYFYDYGNH